MPRPKCCRQIGAMPGKTCFQPEGAPFPSSDEVLLNLDEYEAIRLADLEGLYQEQAASRMNISRQTFGRIIEEARGKVARVLVEGLALRIEGGAIEMAEKRTFGCHECRHKWSVGYGTGGPAACPVCRSNKISRAEEERGIGRAGQGCRRIVSRKPE